MDSTESIRKYISDEVLIDEGSSLRDDTPLWGGVIDSVGLMQLITFLEERFGIEITDDELTSAHFGTVSNIAELVNRKVAGS